MLGSSPARDYDAIETHDNVNMISGSMHALNDPNEGSIGEATRPDPVHLNVES